MLKAENLLKQNSLNQADGIYYGLVDGFAANYSEEQLDAIYEVFSTAGVLFPREYITNENLSTVTCSNVSTIECVDFSDASDASDIYDSIQNGDWRKTRSITSYIKPTAIQYWDQICNVESIVTYDLITCIFLGMTLLTLKEKENVYPGNYQGGYIITRLDTNRSKQLYQSSPEGNGYYSFESDDSQSSPEDGRLLTTKDIGKTIPFKIEWSPGIP